MIYLGTPGRMISLKCPASQRVNVPAQPNIRTTLGGRVQAQLPPRSDRRVWDLQTSDATTPDQVAAIMAFSSGAWGRGPFWFVSADAPVTNMLTPGAASCDPAEVSMLSGAELLGSPPMNLGGDAWAARSVWKTTGNGAGVGGPVPVLPGSRVTASAWIVGAGRVRLVFLDAAGSQVSEADSPLGGLVPARLHVAAAVPGGAVSVRFYVTASVTAVANPAITWTDTVQPISDGQGCAKAILHGASRDLVLTGPGRTYSNLGFTVTEVG